MRLKQHWMFPILLVFFITTMAHADGKYVKFNDPFRVYVGGFWPNIDSEISINGDVLPPVPPLDVEDLLGVTDRKGAGWGGIGWHFAQRHELNFEYFSLDRSGGASDTFTPPVQIGDTFIEGGAINTSYETSVARVTYGFSLLRSERTDFALKAGLHIAKLESGIQLTGQICDPTTTPSTPPGCPGSGTGTESADVTAPLPHVGVSYSYAMTPSLALNVQLLGFALEIDSIDGSIIEASADVAWQPWRHFGIGAGLRYFITNVKSASTELNGEFDFEYFGPTVYFTSTF